jgi:hypothetical protein
MTGRKPCVTTILVLPTQLFSEGLRRMLLGTHFQLNCVAASSDRVPIKFLSWGRDLLFIMGGKDFAETRERVRYSAAECFCARRS